MNAKPTSAEPSNLARGLSLLAAELHGLSLLAESLELDVVKKIANGEQISAIEIEARGIEEEATLDDRVVPGLVDWAQGRFVPEFEPNAGTLDVIETLLEAEATAKRSSAVWCVLEVIAEIKRLRAHRALA